MLIHLAQGCGLRETAVRAHEGGLASVSDAAILKRLKGCGEWFKWMAAGLRQKWLPEFPTATSAWAGRRVRLVDGTMVASLGPGSQWRLHYSIGVPALNCDEVLITSPREGETLKRYSVAAGDILIGDRGYAHPAGIAHVVAHKRDVIIRTNLVTLPMHDAQGVRRTLWNTCEAAGGSMRPMASVGANGQAIDGQRIDCGAAVCGEEECRSGAKGAPAVPRESQRGDTQVRPKRWRRLTTCLYSPP